MLASRLCSSDALVFCIGPQALVTLSDRQAAGAVRCRARAHGAIFGRWRQEGRQAAPPRHPSAGAASDHARRFVRPLAAGARR